MLLFRRYGLLALLLLALLAVGSIRCLTGETSESVAESSSAGQIDEFLDESGQDYDDSSYIDESENGQQELNYPNPSQPPQYPPIYGQNYIPQPPPVHGSYPQPYLPAPVPVYQKQEEYVKPQQEFVYPQKQEYITPLPEPIIPTPVYEQPYVQQTTYSIANNYSAQPKVVYESQQPIYTPPPPPPPPAQPKYQPAPAPAPAPAPVQVPTYQPAPVVIQTTKYVQQPTYKAPAYQQHVVVSNYSVAPPVINKYSLIDLTPFVAPFGYRANHWTLYYYRTSAYRQCPKNLYLSAPSYRDIEAAFAYAQGKLAQYQNAGISYMNSTVPSHINIHQIFHILGQQNAQLDETGLLIELVSSYLADRACLTKWDRQRYLPQLTKFISVSNFPINHACSQLYRNQWQGNLQYCINSRYRTFDGFCNNPYHPYWGKSNVCHIRLLSPDYADGIQEPRVAGNPKFPLPNPRLISNAIHFELPLESAYNLMKMQWGQFINHDITNTALSSYDGLVDCCKNPTIRGCWPIYIPPGDKFYSQLNITCLNFIRSGVCPTCQLGPRQQLNKNTAFLDLSHVYGNNLEQANQLRAFHGGLLKVSLGKNGEILLPVASSQEQCAGTCFLAGDSRVNQHPALTVLHLLLLRNHNHHARALAVRHPNWNDEILFQEARRINIAEYQMITYNEYLPIVFGPILSAYYKLYPQRAGYTYYDPKADPTTWNEYSTASCRFGHSQIQSTFGLYARISGQYQNENQPSFRLKDWFMRPTFLSEGLTIPLINGLCMKPAGVVDPWVASDIRNHLYQSHKEKSGGDLAATNIWRGREHGIPGYVHYVEYCFNIKVRGWKDLQMFIPYYALNSLRKVYRVVENIDLWSGGLAERHFPGADIGPTFACINGIQYYHLKFGDRYYFEHGGQAGSFTPPQLEEIRRATLTRLLCRTAYLPVAPQYAFLAPSIYNPVVNCSLTGEFDYSRF